MNDDRVNVTGKPSKYFSLTRLTYSPCILVPVAFFAVCPVRVKYLLDFQFPLLDRYSYSIFHFRVFSRYFMLNLISFLVF